MLRTRVITALWLAPLAFLLVFGLPPALFSIALAALLLVGTWEFRKLAGLDSGWPGWVLLMIQATLFAALTLAQDLLFEQAEAILPVLVAAWLIMLLRLRSYFPGRGPDPAYRALAFISALVAITGAWIALTLLRFMEQGSWWIVALLLIIWSADIGAYFTGKAFGKHKLAPRLSPGKTIEGLAGGLIAAAVVGWLAVRLMPLDVAVTPAWLFLAGATALLSVGGDLFISLHKRTSGHKDSGRIFPGHGGVLDRLDSLLAGAPLFALAAFKLGNPV